MFAVCVFRRFGLSVPVTLFLVGLLLESTLDKKYGSGYFTSHLWAIGLNLLLSGIITGVISCIVDPPDAGGSSAGYSPLDISDIGDKIEEVGSSARDSLEHFITEPSEEDMFCYVPLNWCSLALSILGIIFICVDYVLPK